MPESLNLDRSLLLVDLAVGMLGMKRNCPSLHHRSWVCVDQRNSAARFLFRVSNDRRNCFL